MPETGTGGYGIRPYNRPRNGRLRTYKKSRQSANAPCPFLRKLLTQTQLSDQGTVTVDVLLLQIGQQIAAAADHLEQAAAAVVVMLVGLKVLGQVIDTSGQQSNLDLRRTGVTLVDGCLSDDGLLIDSDRSIRSSIKRILLLRMVSLHPSFLLMTSRLSMFISDG